ncbi:MAG: hypothetical protein JO134_19005 [Xanthobacteraceae bacterium]|nr:hypothetical protein [Xanthobacteraceae bacterium]
MIAYVFWHAPLAAFSPQQYATALLDFHKELGREPSPGLASCVTYQISQVPWLNRRQRYEDWYFLRSCADLDALNEAAVKPSRWDIHAGIATKMEIGYGGLYQHLHGDEQPRGGDRAIWLTRPRGIRYQPVLEEIIDGSTGFLSCWRRQMVLGPGDEFVITGTSSLALTAPAGWQTRTVERVALAR